MSKHLPKTPAKLAKKKTKHYKSHHLTQNTKPRSFLTTYTYTSGYVPFCKLRQRNVDSKAPVKEKKNTTLHSHCYGQMSMNKGLGGSKFWEKIKLALNCELYYSK